MEAIYSSKTFVDFRRITWSYIPEDGFLALWALRILSYYPKTGMEY
jgi:hypothetical protein